MTPELPSPPQGASGFRSLDKELGWRGIPGEIGDLIGISYGRDTDWNLIADYQGEAGSARVTFQRPISYRVHDEGEIWAYWGVMHEACAPSFAYEIAQSGYLTELNYGVSAILRGPLRHFLIGGRNLQLEVLSRALPQLSYEPSSPEG